MEIFKYARLILDEPRDIYYSGQVLSGHIDCEITEPLTYSAININILGEANVRWTESETEEYNGVRRYINVKYSGYESYFNTMLCISGGSGVVTLPPGAHQVPFQYQIPHTAPSSFSGNRGSVSYKLVAYIEYPDPTRERNQLEKAFEVVAPLNLNIGNDIKKPIDLEFEECYSCCCSSSPLNIRIHIPASGFCPGQAIPISVSAENESSVEVKSIRFDLIQKECYHSIQPKSDYIPPDEVLQSLKIGAILSQSKRESTYELIVPDFIAPNLQNCNIIDVGYFIKATIKLSGCNDDLEDDTEICLGLIPITSLAPDFTHPMKSDLPQAAIPDPNFVMAPPVQNMEYQMNGHIQNSSAYPTASPYPNQGGPFPAVSPYPSSQPPQSIPMSNLRTGNIGFVADSTPYPGGNSMPYPTANNAPYPTANNAPYPTGNNSQFPTPNSAPYPTSNSSPYPVGNSAPYPAGQPGYQGYPPAPYPVNSAPSAPPPS